MKELSQHSKLLRRLIFFTVLIAVIGWIETANGQIVNGKQIVSADIMVSSATLSDPFTVAIYFSVEPGWYLYWKNPGDAGLPVAIQWELPEGYRAGDVQFPTPTKIVHDDLVSYGYYDEMALFVTITPPATSRSSDVLRLAAKLDWLVCKESCIRGGKNVEWNSTASVDFARVERILRQHQDQLPLPPQRLNLTLHHATTTKTAEGFSVVAMFAGTDAVRVTDFYPEPLDEASIDFKSIKVTEGSIFFNIIPNSSSVRLHTIKGLLIVDGKGYEYELPLDS